MLYSNSIENEKLNLFITFLMRILEGHSAYKKFVDPVIQETHELAIGKKSPYQINRDKYPIIISLNKKNSPFFECIDPSNLSNTQYKQVLDLLFEQKPVIIK